MTHLFLSYIKSSNHLTILNAIYLAIRKDITPYKTYLLTITHCKLKFRKILRKDNSM